MTCSQQTANNKHVSTVYVSHAINSSIVRVDFQLSRESLLLNLLKQIWTGCNNRDPGFSLLAGKWSVQQSCVGDASLLYRVTEDVVAFHHRVSHLPQTPEDRDVMAHGFTGLVQSSPSLSSLLAALIFYATGTANCSPLLHCKWFVTIRAASSARMWG